MTKRRALHLAQVIQMAVRERPDEPPSEYPERAFLGSENERQSPWKTAALIGARPLALEIGFWLWGRRMG
jgi:hypothetical protein